MGKRVYISLFIAGLIINILISYFQQVPSYMDAAYYYSNGIQIATGKGLFEPFIWNYLDDPSGLPHTSHIYWMPMISLLSSLGMVLVGKTDYSSAKIVFIFLSSFLPPLTAFIASRLKLPYMNSFPERGNEWLAGLLALFPGFYALYTNTTDSFTMYMILGSIFIILFQGIGKQSYWRLFLLGCIAGLMHLSRADGIIWFVAALFIGVVYIYNKRQSGIDIKDWGIFCTIPIGYALIMSPWYIRNIQLFGKLFPPGGTRTLWLLDYDQIFSYPPTQLNLNNWWRAGLFFHLNTWLNAFWANLKTILGVQGLVFLLPLMIVGLWNLRHDASVRLGMLMWAFTLIAMTFVFPFPGARGGYFHSSASVQPLLWAVTGYGLDGFIQAGARWRNWIYVDARRIFSIGVISICALLTGLIFINRQVGSDCNRPIYRQSWDKYIKIENKLISLGLEPQQTVLIKNPPMYYAANRRSAYVIPDGNIEVLKMVAIRYQIKWIVLEKDHTKGLNDLYQNPDREIAGLEYLGNDGDNQFFIIQ